MAKESVHRFLQKYSFFYLLVFLTFFLMPFKLASAVELIQNGNFQNGLSFWNIYENAEYENNPLVEPNLDGDFKFNLHPDPNYFGLVVYQPLNITNISGKTLTLNMNLTNVWHVVNGSSISAYIAYVTTTNNLVQEKISSFPNNSIIEPDQSVTATFTFPSTGIKKLVGFGIAKEGYGEFLVDNISLQISGSPTIGNLPIINNIDKARGPYGTILTITGSNFGNTQGLTSIVTLGDSEDGISIQSWNDSQVVVKIDDPAIDGSVVVVNDFVPSNNDKKFKITSPNYQISVDNTFKTYIKGSKARFFIETTFENGYSTMGGINFSLDPEYTTNLITNSNAFFKNVPVKIEGGTILEIDTSGLPAGMYSIGVIADDGVLATRKSGVFVLEIVGVQEIKIYHDNNEVTGNSININNQNNFSLFYEVFDLSGKKITPPSIFEETGIRVISDNENIITVYKQFWGEEFFANDNGTANLIFSTNEFDGYSRGIAVNVNLPDTPKITSLYINPSQIINDPGSNGQSFTYNAQYNTASCDYIGWGMYGLYDIDFSNTEVFWGTGTATASGNWTIRGRSDSNYNDYVMPIDIGTTIITGSCSGNNVSIQRSTKLNIINTPGTAMISGKVIPAGGFGEVFYIEFYDAEGNFLFPRLAQGYHFQPFIVGFIPPGYYKLKFVFNGNAKDYWYPNAFTFNDAQTINLVGNQNFSLPFVVATENLPKTPWINPVKKEFGSKPLNVPGSQTFTFKNIGFASLQIGDIRIVGDEAFTLNHDCPNILLPLNNCSITITFTPQSIGKKVGYLRIEGENPELGEYLEVPLSGIGQAPVSSGSVLINNNDQYTNSRTVTLSITCDDPEGCSQMCISNDTPTCSTFITFATSKSWSLSSGDGLKTVYVKLKNKNNQVGDPFSDSIILDVTPPLAGTFTASPDDGQVTLNWSGYSDATSGISQYVVYGGTSLPSSCSGTALYSGLNGSFIHTALTNGTTYYYRLCIYDNAGNLTTATTSAKPLPETDPPALQNFLINNGDLYTKLNNVTLSIYATDESGIDKICVSNTNSCTNWINYVTSMNWTLPTGAGEKTVYLWLRDTWGNTNATPFTATIVLDNVPPVDSTYSLLVSPGNEQNSIILRWYYSNDAHSFVKEYRIMRSLTSTGTSCNGTPIAIINVSPAVMEYLEYLDTNLLAGKTYYYRVCAVDAAGNISSGKTGRGKCNDTLGPVDPFVIINNGDEYSKTSTVTLSFGANDVGGVAKVCIGNSPTSFSCSNYNALLPSKTWRLPTPSGEKTVYVKFLDGAGNQSEIVSDSIWLDMIKPIDGKLTGMSGNGFVLLSWQDAVEAGGSGFDKYIVKLGTTSYPSCTTGETLYEGLNKSFIHEGLINGTTYYYRVCAVDKAGNISSGRTYLGKPSNVTTITGSFPIATSTKREQAMRVSFDGTNYAVAIKGVGSSSNSIGVQFLTKDGVKIGSPLLINGLSGVEPQIAYGNGKYLVTWSDDIYRTVRGQLINASTRTIDGSPFDISQTALSAGCIDTYANPIFDGNNFFVIWNYDAACTDNGSGHDVFGRFVDTYGNRVGDIINLIDETATGRQEYHAMTFDGDLIYVFWQDARRGVAISNPCGGPDITSVLTDIYGQIISKSSSGTPGAKSGNNFPVYESMNIVDFEMFDATHNGVSVNVVFQEMTLKCLSGNIDIEKSNIIMAEVYSDGTVSGNYNVTNGATFKYFAPQVKASDDGTVLITWNDLTNMSNMEIWAQRYSGDGIPIGDPFLLVSKNGNQFGGVENYDNDKFFILWNDKITVDMVTQDFLFGDVYGVLISFP